MRTRVMPVKFSQIYMADQLIYSSFKKTNSLFLGIDPVIL
jgi:hypothetical protein